MASSSGWWVCLWLIWARTCFTSPFTLYTCVRCLRKLSNGFWGSIVISRVSGSIILRHRLRESDSHCVSLDFLRKSHVGQACEVPKRGQPDSDLKTQSLAVVHLCCASGMLRNKPALRTLI